MGLLSDFIGGAASGAGDYYAQLAKQQEKEREQEREQARELEQKKMLLELQAEIDGRKSIAVEELKERMASKKQQAIAESSEKVDEMAPKVGDDRRFSKFMADFRQAGYGEGMDDAAIREVFDQHYNNVQSTAEKGGDRYMDKGRTDAAMDRYNAAKRVGNADLIDAEYKGVSTARQLDAEDAKTARADAAAAAKERLAELNALGKERAQELANNRFMAQLNAQSTSAEMRNAVSSAQSTLRTTRATMPKEPEWKNMRPNKLEAAKKEYADAMGAWKQSEDGQAYSEALTFLRGIQKQTPAMESGTQNAPPKTMGAGDPPAGSGVVQPQDPAAALAEAIQQRDALLKQHTTPNKAREEVLASLDRQIADLRSSTKPSESKPSGQQSQKPTDAAVAKPTSKAEFDALPKGARFVNPKDGKVYIKN